VRWYGGGQAPALPVHIRQRARNLARVSALVFLFGLRKELNAWDLGLRCHDEGRVGVFDVCFFLTLIHGNWRMGHLFVF
jgi:hypothetical protein